MPRSESRGTAAAGDPQLLAFIVDHALRPDSAADAAAAAQLSGSLGLQVCWTSLVRTPTSWPWCRSWLTWYDGACSLMCWP